METIDRLAAEWLDHKRAEDRAAEARIATERAIIEHLNFTHPEGAKTFATALYKLTLTQPVSRKVDPAMWDQVRHLVPANLQPVKWKIEADGPGCKYLRDNEPDFWAKIAPAFEVRPGKVGVKVEAK